MRPLAPMAATQPGRGGGREMMKKRGKGRKWRKKRVKKKKNHKSVEGNVEKKRRNESEML